MSDARIDPRIENAANRLVDWPDRDHHHVIASLREAFDLTLAESLAAIRLAVEIRKRRR